ncbi:MAG: hypothetical protein OXE77_02815 [Flavobacteriaceae bacterium]|nr:hypothetical protein [Flavobacteriaceae bacterium]MCY4267844.1 hypothetical protein [Flavobacteriaceae bacterium]MCY4298596.1 hypothetical protein [Flavobacteriaceae bacterium]
MTTLFINLPKDKEKEFKKILSYFEIENCRVATKEEIIKHANRVKKETNYKYFYER